MMKEQLEAIRKGALEAIAGAKAAARNWTAAAGQVTWAKRAN